MIVVGNGPTGPEHAERRQRTEARLRHLERAQQWDEDGFWARHSAEKGHVSGDRAGQDIV
ncbi:hypothetical protein ABZ871_17695 [Streptomyces populi]